MYTMYTVCSYVFSKHDDLITVVYTSSSILFSFCYACLILSFCLNLKAPSSKTSCFFNLTNRSRLLLGLFLFLNSKFDCFCFFCFYSYRAATAVFCIKMQHILSSSPGRLIYRLTFRKGDKWQGPSLSPTKHHANLLVLDRCMAFLANWQSRHKNGSGMAQEW